eukprot:1157809-Pelagomonas_calceolata.AAC.9
MICRAEEQLENESIAKQEEQQARRVAPRVSRIRTEATQSFVAWCKATTWNQSHTYQDVADDQ